MTREEHWKIVDAVIDANKDNEMGGKYAKAFNHGVQSAFNRVCKALEDIEKKQQLRDCKTCKHSDKGNCAGTEECHECMWTSKYEQQPSDSNISDPCDGCRYELNSTNGNPCYSCGKYKLTEQQPSENVISRQAVLDYAKDTCLDLDKYEDTELFCDEIKALPSVYPERPKGKWLHIYKSDIACECSVCHIQMPITEYFHYCPNCGAEMSGGEEE